MDANVLYPILDAWYNTGELLESDKPLIQAGYTELTGDPGERCRTCPNYWSDVQHTLRYHFIKVLGYSQMKDNQEYMISPEAGYLEVHGEPFVYITKGTAPESASAKHLTDEIARKLLADNPSRSAVIVKNPDYGKDDEKETGKESTKPAKPAPTTKAATKSTTKKAAKPAPTPPVDATVTLGNESGHLDALATNDLTDAKSSEPVNNESQDPAPNA